MRYFSADNERVLGSMSGGLLGQDNEVVLFRYPSDRFVPL